MLTALVNLHKVSQLLCNNPRMDVKDIKTTVWEFGRQDFTSDLFPLLNPDMISSISYNFLL